MFWKRVAHGSLWLATAMAQETAPQPQIVQLVPGVSAPRLLKHVDPDYTEEARRAGLEGTVLLSLVVDENGEPKDIKVIKSLGLGLDEKAVDAAYQWRFQPGMKDGKPVRVGAKFEMNFRLLRKGWNAGKPVFTGAGSPPVLRGTRFEKPKTPTGGSVTLAFDVDHKGKPQDVHIVHTSNVDLDDPAVASVRKWRFHPAIKAGKPIPASGSVELTFEP